MESEAIFMLQSAGEALALIFQPERMMYLGLGALLGIILGIIPGIGGLTGTALLIPFTYAMDPFTAFAFLLGLASTTGTGDPIPAVLFGVPGGAGSAATVLDGVPMAKRGEAGRALSASYMSSLMGGVFGALLMAIAIPVMRPLVLLMGSPELFALTIFGISMVALLSGNAPLRGLAAGGLGVMLSLIGQDPQTATFRWTFDTTYLWDGLPLVAVVLGLFALPELADLAIARTAIAKDAPKHSLTKGMWQGAADCFRNWWLVLRCSWLGAAFGAVPGMGGAVIDWLAYGHALRTEKGAKQTFGRGDVRGVIASESANNAKEGGALIPTVAFGVPGSAGMAILLGAFLVHGLVPGPEMLTTNLTLTYSMVWSIAIANIVGAGICYAFSGQLARIATLRYTLILPAVMTIVYVGAFQGRGDWGDLYVLMFFGVVGWLMKQFKWPRAPLILGFVLGDSIERYMAISISRFGMDWLTRPIVLCILALTLFALLRPIIQDFRNRETELPFWKRLRAPLFHRNNLFGVFFLLFVGTMVAFAWGWNWEAKAIPVIVGIATLLAAGAGLLADIFVRQPAEGTGGNGGIHMDLDSGTSHLGLTTVAKRASAFFGWLIALMAGMATIGLLPSVPLFIVAFMRMEGREPWRLTLLYAFFTTLFFYVAFDYLLHLPWPPTLLGGLFPAAKIIPSL